MLPDLGCTCANLRRAARLVTQLYSEEMGAHVEPAQYALLSALQRKPGISQSILGKILGLDKTTLSRNLRVLEKRGWLESVPADDKRERGFRLTQAGAQTLAAAHPGWERAQTRLQAELPNGAWEQTQEVVLQLTMAASGGASRKSS